MNSNEAMYRRLIDEAFNQGKLDVIDELVSPDALEHQRGTKPGRQGVKETVTYLRSAFPDFKLTIDSLVADGDRVWAIQRGTGTNLGSFAGKPPSGRQMDITVIDVCRFENGALVEHWGVPDQLGAMLQLGFIAG